MFLFLKAVVSLMSRDYLIFNFRLIITVIFVGLIISFMLDCYRRWFE